MPPENEETRRGNGGLSEGEVAGHDSLPNSASAPYKQRTAKTRKRKSPAFYLAVLYELARPLREQGLTFAELDDLSGLNDGHSAHCFHPDTPTGRVARCETLDLICQALFPRGYRIKITDADPIVTLVTTEQKPAASEHLNQIRHWRLSKYFCDMGARGGAETARRHGQDFVKKRGRRGARIRWRRHRERQKSAVREAKP